MGERGKEANTIWRLDARPVSRRARRRVGREREQGREVGEQPVHDLDGLLGVVNGDVDVQSEDAPSGDVLQLVDQVLGSGRAR